MIRADPGSGHSGVGRLAGPGTDLVAREWRFDGMADDMEAHGTQSSSPWVSRSSSGRTF